MSRLAWLTPDSLPEPAICRRVFVPLSVEAEAAFRGAFLLLCNPNNWEQFGSITPEEMASCFKDAFFSTQDTFETECEARVHYVGEVFLFTSFDIPAGSLLCNGALLSIQDYAALYAVIGTAFGGDGVTTFALPDLAGRVPVGAGNSWQNFDPGDQGGEHEHTLTTGEIPAHNHGIDSASAGSLLLRNTAAFTGAVSNLDKWTAVAGGGDAHNNMQEYTVLPFCIQYE